MENRYSQQICFDLQLDQQMLDEIDQIFDQNNGTVVQSMNDSFTNNFDASDSPSNKSMDGLESTSEPNYYHTNDENLHLVPKFEPNVSGKTNLTSEQCLSDIETFKLKLSAKVDEYCLKIIRDMNIIGVSIIDNLLGRELGELISNEVWHLYQTVINQLITVIKYLSS